MVNDGEAGFCNFFISDYLLLKNLNSSRASPGETDPTQATTPTSMSALENLFQIAQRGDKSGAKTSDSPAKTIVSVTSSSSSSSVSRSHTGNGAR